MDYNITLSKWKGTRLFKEIEDISDLDIGMDVYAVFYPASQTYIDILYPIWGTITHTGEVIDDIIVLQEDRELRLMHPGCHYFGMVKGYDFSVYAEIK